MIYVQKIRKLIYNLLNYYELKEIKHINNYNHYYLYKSKLYLTDFECLSTENRIGLNTVLNNKKAIICLNLLKMLHDRDYEFLITVYTYIVDNDLFDENIEFHTTLKSPKMWIQMLSMYFDNNDININKFNQIPRPLKNYKSKFKQRFFEVSEIKNYYYEQITN